jgi:WD40 repeat protein
VAKTALLVLAAVLLAGPSARAQEHVRLMPHLRVDHVPPVAFSPDGRYALTGSHDNTVCPWDGESGEKIRALIGHTEEVICTEPAEKVAQSAQVHGQEDDITVLTLTFAPAQVLHA